MTTVATKNRKSKGTQAVATHLLLEDYVRGSRQLTVDRDKGIIRGIKILGNFSSNVPPKIHGADGTEYTLAARKKAAHLYEGRHVNINHAGDRTQPGKVPSCYDRFGRLQNVQVEEDGSYADLKYLKKHAMAEVIIEAAEEMPDLFCMSHNADGIGEVVHGKFVIREIPRVRSVDVVTEGGTVRSLVESSQQDQPMQKPIRDILKEAAQELGSEAVAVIEDLGDALPVLEMDMPEAPSPEEHLKAGFRAACLAVLDDESMDASAKVAKLKQLLKGHEKMTKAKESSDDDSEGKKEEKVEAKESKQLDPLKQENTALKLCMEAGVKPSAPLLKALVLLEEADMQALIQEHKPATGKQQAGAGSGAKSQAAGAVVIESKEPKAQLPAFKTAAERASFLRNGRVAVLQETK